MSFANLILMYESVIVSNMINGVMHRDIIKNHKKHLEYLGFIIFNNGTFQLPKDWKMKKNNYSPYSVKFLNEFDEVMFYVNFNLSFFKKKQEACISWNVKIKTKL
jgi:hypothetical protein